MRDLYSGDAALYGGNDLYGNRRGLYARNENTLLYRNGRFYEKAADGSWALFTTDDTFEDEAAFVAPERDYEGVKQHQAGIDLRRSAPGLNRPEPAPDAGPPDPVDHVPLQVQQRDVPEVKYISRPEVRRLKYGVSLAQTMTRRGQVLDTAAIYGQFSSKDRTGNSPLGRCRLAPFGRAAEFRDLVREWAASLIFVCTQEPWGPQFYSHVGKSDRFHHSSFTGERQGGESLGGDLIGAGQWIVEQGVLKKVNAASGHYLPGLEHLRQTLELLQDAIRPETEVLVWDENANTWTYVKAQTFAQETSGGGFKSHPLAG